MNWKKRYKEPIVGDRVRVTEPLDETIEPFYPTEGETIIITEIKEVEESNKKQLGYYFSDEDKYLLRREFEMVIK